MYRKLKHHRNIYLTQQKFHISGEVDRMLHFIKAGEQARGRKGKMNPRGRVLAEGRVTFTGRGDRGTPATHYS